MKKLSLALSLAFVASAFADVPALINYQGRLVDGVGNPIVGKKEFKLDIYDSQTEGTLIYQETLPEITLDEDGAYSFQFGAGESRSETSVLVATGDGEAAFFQKVFEETPVGVISVTDGTNTFKTGDVPTGDEPFSFTYTASLKRLNLVCNEPPAEGVKFTATFRYAESGIMGALGSAAEHWMEVTIGGDKQEPRQRLVAVPFALRAGVAERVTKREPVVFQTGSWSSFYVEDNTDPKRYRPLTNPDNPAKKILGAKLLYAHRLDDTFYPFFEIIRVRKKMWNDYLFGVIPNSGIEFETVWSAARIQPNKLEADSGATITFQPISTPPEGESDFVVTISWGDGITFDPDYFYFYGGDSVIVAQRPFAGLVKEVFTLEK
jgi:hypothetical protein